MSATGLAFSAISCGSAWPEFLLSGGISDAELGLDGLELRAPVGPFRRAVVADGPLLGGGARDICHGGDAERGREREMFQHEINPSLFDLSNSLDSVSSDQVTRRTPASRSSRAIVSGTGRSVNTALASVMWPPRTVPPRPNLE